MPQGHFYWKKIFYFISINALDNSKCYYLLKQQKALERAKIFDISNIHNNLIDIYRAEMNKLD